MKRFKNILYASFSSGAETSSLKQAIELAAANHATLQVLLVYPQLPKSHDEFRSNYESVLLEKMEDSVQSLLAELHQPHSHTVKINIEGAKAVANTIVRRVLRDGHDLLIKEAESVRKGFKAIDMDLLRQCPCPVWLNRAADEDARQKNIAVAIDPDDNTGAGPELAKRMLELGFSLAHDRKGKLTVISCWDYVYEHFLRHNAWTPVPDDEVQKLVRSAEQDHRSALDELIQQAGLGKNIAVEHLRGQADELIPHIVEQNSIDLIVMGTVARTGIPGFIIGNTAENIAQRLPCSLLAMKPGDFSSSVKA